MATMTFRHGEYRAVDYTPGVAVSAGDVVVTADTPRVAHRDIAANELGALAATGGVYRGTADGAIGADKVVRWDAANAKVSLTAGAKVFGVTVSASTTDGDAIDVRHDPSAAGGAVIGAVTTVAAAGSAQGDAAALSEGFNHVTGADATKGVVLPTAAAGKQVTVKNSDAANAVLKVYPPTGGTINALSANAAISMAAKSSADFYAISATAWITVPTVPS